MLRPILLLCILLLSVSSQSAKAQESGTRTKYKGGPAYIYRVGLTDKVGTPYSTDRPSHYLSRRAIERRRRQGLAIDSTDLPVNPRYVRRIEGTGVSVVGQSRWQNTVLVRVKDTTQMAAVEALSCVSHCRRVWTAPDSIAPTAVKSKYQEHFEEYDSVAGQPYGTAFQQISQMRGDRLHAIGLRGEGMMIAILDGGFKNADRIPVLQRAAVCGWHDFVCPPSPNVFSETDHGTRVLSAMAAYEPYYYVGTAPQASYWLLRSEDLQTEQEVEEDYWTMAAEYADSVGCDIINSSLGYTDYDAPCRSYALWQLDGHTAFISRSASLLAGKGIVLVNSAGNSGMGPRKKIGVPADATDILTVGAVTPDEPARLAPFSSIGPSHDGRTKPDVVAAGAPTRLINGRGVITDGMGTSFSTPLVCGLVACLWQGMPDKTALQIIDLIRQSGSNHEHPDNIYGHGVPNFWRAYMVGKMENHEQ